jgi:subtilisin family serine protease
VKNVTRTLICSGLGTLTILFMIPLLNVQGQGQRVAQPGGKQAGGNARTPLIYSRAAESNGFKFLQAEDPHEVVKVIVTLKDKPLALHRKKGALQKTSLATVLSSLQAVHASVKSKLGAVAQQLSAGSNFHYRFTALRDYYRALNGIAMECNRGLLKNIRAMPEVQSVFFDQEVRIDLKQSVHQIGADVVQDSLGYKGDSVVVGDVDTGIDYNNPALGGGFGPGFRVIGGYDFWNNDNDPMDDHGHGTHVAGIIGANGGPDLTGVAPRVKFLAVKVLSADGYGDDISVFAGLDFCMDPDGNPETDDAVDVINMSLGGDPFPLMDTVVNNMSAAGVLSVVAAGNSGGVSPSSPRYKSIGSPGTAETALTVGACDSSDQMASFSSKGPDPIHLAIKPEVVGPGVNILSSVLNNRTESWSGTSMATPHVTGVAALLTQMHRNWTPAQIKSAIVNSAKSLNGIAPYVGGNGRVSAVNAAKIGLMVDKCVLSCGFADLSFDVWKDTLEFKVKNLRNVPQNVTLSVQFDVSTAAEMSLSQTNVSLSPMQETAVTAILSVPQSVPLLQSGSHAYSGRIVCTSDSDRVQVPFGFIKSNMMIIDADCQPLQLLLWGNNYLDGISPTEGVYRYELLLGQAIVNLYALLRDVDDQGNGIVKTNYYHVIRKNISTTGFNYIVLGHHEAPLCAFKTDQLLDISNQPIQGIDSAAYQFGFYAEAENVYLQLDDSSEGYSGRLDEGNVYLSPMDTSIQIFQRLAAVSNTDAILLHKFCRGAANQVDLTLPSGAGNLSDINVKFDYQPSQTCYPRIDYTGYDYATQWIPYWLPISMNLRGLNRVHYSCNRDTSETFPIRYGSSNLVIVKEGDSYHSGSRFYSSQLRINDDGGATFFERKKFRVNLNEMYDVEVLDKGDTVCFSDNLASDINLPAFMLERFDFGNSPSNLLLIDHWASTRGGGVNRPDGAREYHYSDPSDPPKFTHRLYSKNRLLAPQPASESVDDVSEEFFQYNSSEFGLCRLLAATAPYSLLGQAGQSAIDYEFGFCGGVGPAAIAPMYSYFMHSLDLFQVLGDGKPVKWLHPGQDGRIRLVLFDPKVNVDTVSVSILNDDGSERKLVTTHPAEKEYLASLPGGIPQGFVDIIARARNADGNKFELSVSPAFYFGNDTNSLQFESRIRMNDREFLNTNAYRFNARDTLRYILSYRNYGNATARNLIFHFPETAILRPLSPNVVTIDSLYANDSCTIALSLQFLGKTKYDQYVYYTPSVTWTSGTKSLTRTDKILLDLSISRVTSTETENSIPRVYALYDNYPNPFNPKTVISYQLPAMSRISLKIYDILGREVAVLANEVKAAGKYSIQWDAHALSSGVYFYRLQARPIGGQTDSRLAGGYSATKKLLLLK